jgi:uncharacterized membrane protein YeiH
MSFFSEPMFMLATAIFAITGVLAVSRREMDALSLVIIGAVTAIGGGTLRDLLLGVPVFWLDDVSYLYVSAAAAALTFLFMRHAHETERLLLYADGVATSMFAVVAFEKATALGHPAAIATVMGVLTGAGGGLIRDVITGHETILLRRELYITPILASAVVYFAAREWTAWPAASTATAAMLVGATIRCTSLWRGWTFPPWLSHRPGAAGR